MPNRMLRDWTDSDKMKGVTAQGERFFTRLIMKVDDYGCLYADSSLLKAALFPFLLNEVREADISRWTAECEKAGLIVLYEVAGKKYLQIGEFKQRLDKARNRYPLPTSGNSITMSTEFPAELEAEQEVEEKGKKKEESAPSAPRPPSFKKMVEKDFYDEIAKHAKDYPKDMLRKFFDYWKEPSATGIMRFQLQKTWDTGLRLCTWAEKDQNFKSEKNGIKPGVDAAGKPGTSEARVHAARNF